MYPWECNAIAFDGHRKAVALGVGRSLSLVDNWCKPPRDFDGEGEASPVQRFIETELALRAAGAPGAGVLVRYALAELGYRPTVRMSTDGGVDESMTLLDVAAVVKGFSEYLESVGRSNADGVLTAGEASVVASEIEKNIELMARQLHGLHKFIAQEESASERRRKGPQRAIPRYIQLRSEAAAV